MCHLKHKLWVQCRITSLQSHRKMLSVYSQQPYILTVSVTLTWTVHVQCVGLPTITTLLSNMAIAKGCDKACRHGRVLAGPAGSTAQSFGIADTYSTDCDIASHVRSSSRCVCI